jgi:hypothetical protein
MATSQPFRRLDCTCNRTKALPFKAMGGMLDVSTFSSSFRAFFTPSLLFLPSSALPLFSWTFDAASDDVHSSVDPRGPISQATP